MDGLFAFGVLWGVILLVGASIYHARFRRRDPRLSLVPWVWGLVGVGVAFWVLAGVHVLVRAGQIGLARVFLRIGTILGVAGLIAALVGLVGGLMDRRGNRYR